MMTVDMKRYNLSLVIISSCYQVRQEQSSCENCSDYCEHEHHDDGQQEHEGGVPFHPSAGCHRLTSHYLAD